MVWMYNEQVLLYSMFIDGSLTLPASLAAMLDPLTGGVGI
jgi:hypothetical protein